MLLSGDIMDDRQKLLKKISSVQFAAWELHIYLDTHPDDDAAIKSLKCYEKDAKALIKDYEFKYGPLVSDSVYGDSRFEWVNNPWPWEPQRSDI